MKKIIFISIALAMLTACAKSASSTDSSSEEQTSALEFDNEMVLLSYMHPLYSISYPSIWDCKAQPEYGTDVYIGDVNEMLGFSVCHTENANKALEEIRVKQIEAFNSLGFEVVDEIETKISGVPAYKITAIYAIGGKETLRNISFVFVKDNTFYNIRFGNDPKLVKDNARLIDKIIATFKTQTKINRNILGIELGASEQDLCRTLKANHIKYKLENLNRTERGYVCKNVNFADKRWDEMYCGIVNNKIHMIAFFKDADASSFGSSLAVTYYEWLKQVLDSKYSETDIKSLEKSTDITYDTGRIYYDGQTILKLRLTGDKDEEMTCWLIYQDEELANQALSSGMDEL